jgi:hypothetical protein
MEWVLRDIDNADPNVDDIIIGSTGKTWKEVLVNHQKDIKITGYIERTHSNCRFPQGKYFYEGGGILLGTLSGRKRDHQHREN